MVGDKEYQKVYTRLFPKVSSKGADEDCIDWYSKGRIDQADPAPQLCFECDPPVSDALEDKVQNMYCMQGGCGGHGLDWVDLNLGSSLSWVGVTLATFTQAG